MEKFYKWLNLQLFAGEGVGAGGGDGGAPATESGAKGTDLRHVKYGIQEGAPSEPMKPEKAPEEERHAKFKALMEGDYKDLFDAHVEKATKSGKEAETKLSELSPILTRLGEKYGVDSSDVKALMAAIEEDDSFYEEEALKKGTSVEEVKKFRKMERENADLKRQMAEQANKDNAVRQYSAWVKQAEEAKALYPSLDLNTETKNPQFRKLLMAGIDVATAYHVIHKDEILPAAMQHTARVVEQKLVNSVRAGGKRPSENGASGQSPSLVKSDVTKLTSADRREIRRRVLAGEKIRF